MENYSDGSFTSLPLQLIMYLCPCGRSSKYDLRNIQDNQDGQIEGETVITQQEVSRITQKHTIENEESLEPAPDIEIPPPMPVQDHTIALGTTEISEKFASTLSLKTQQECSLDLASEIENLVKQRMDPQPDTGQGSDSGGEGGEDSVQDKEAEREKYIQKRKYVINELIETEQDYVKDLGSIVEGYMGYLAEQQLSDEMKEKCKIVFGNIHQIYDWHNETFKEELEKCVDDPDRIAMLFTRYERRLSMYVKYCENKPKSEYIVSEFIDTFFEEIRQKLNHRLNLADLLIKPVQRIMKYQLILKDILKYTERAGLDTTALRKAYNVMMVVPKDANDMMQFGRLQGYDGKITAVGKLLLQDTLLVAEISNSSSGSKGNQVKFKERRVFLFEQIILFSEMTEKKRGNIVSAHYLFKNSLKVNKMSMTENVENDPVKFMLKDQTPGADVKFLIQAPSEDVKRTWVSAVQKILEMQGDFLRALQSPIAFFNKEKELTKELSAPELSNSGKDSHLRKTQSQPQPARGTNLGSPAKGRSRDDRGQGDLNQGDGHKHSRCKSVPTPLNQKVSIPGAGPEFRDSSCPSSPVAECSKDFTQEKDSKKAANNLSNSSIPESGDSVKPKKTIFEGFRNTLRKSKDGSAKSDNSYANSSDGNEEAESRTSNQGDIAPPTKQPNGAESLDNEQNLLIENNAITMGRVLFTYNAVKEDEVSVNKGEIVQVMGTNQYNMFLVHRPANQSSPPAEGWVPMYIIGSREGDGSLNKTPWQMFKMKKSATRIQDRGGWGQSDWRSKTLPLMREGRSNKMPFADDMYEMSPSVHAPLTSIMVQAGDTAILTCRICGRPRPSITWKFQDSILLTPNARTLMTYAEDGFATLQLSQVTISDSGEYCCIATSDIGSVITRATLTVLDRPGPPSKPQIKTQVGTSVHLEWTPPSTIDCGMIQGYTVEYNEVGLEYWQAAIPYVPNTSQVIGDLNPGSTYQFRVSANNKIGMSEPSVPSEYVTIPSEFELGEKDEGNFAMWKTTYENDFTEIDEIERGRFALVKKLCQKCSGQEVAAKCIKKRLVTKEMVETEFNTLQSLQHDNLIQVFDLYESPSNLVIVMQFLPHGRLFDYICSTPPFDELQAAEYIRQLLDVLHYLHNCRIAHLDVKPENLLIDIRTSTTASIKLVDFGDARHIYNHYYIHIFNGNPEFMPPEIVGGTPVSLLSDIWSVGVVMYVMLSGVSPFLDESEEETSSNILRNDYCFPEEFFAGISTDAKDMIKLMLVDDQSKRPTTQACLESSWIKKVLVPRTSQIRPMPIDTARLAHFIERRKHQVLTP